MTNIVQQKIEQAIALLKADTSANAIDCWLTFARETSQVHDPAIDLILGFGVTWDSAFLITRTGEAIAIVGRFDGDNVRKLNAYTQVLTYDQGIGDVLRETIVRLAPQRLGLNFSLSTSSADGLTHGMFLRLQRMLGDVVPADGWLSAEEIVRRLREHKASSELELIKEVTRRTEQVYAEMFKLPVRGMSEKEIHHVVGEIVAKYDCEFAGERINNPIVNAGPDSSIGHGIPSNLRVQPGQILHYDMWLQRDGYCSDLQRVGYVLREGETDAPDLVKRAWDACWIALEAGKATLRPGVAAWDVDQVAREALMECGYPEYMHAFGHHVGKRVHDGGSVLGPRWDRYGDMPYKPIEIGSVFTLELGVIVEGYGYIGIEEMVVVTAAGNAYLSTPQKDLMLL